MIKTQGFRKLATAVAVFATAMFLAACSTPSSTDEALSHPGDNFAGSYVFSVDPANDKFDVAPVQSLTGTQVSVKDGFSVTTTPGVCATPPCQQYDYVAKKFVGTSMFTNPNTRGFVRMQWKGADRLEDVSIRITSTTNVNITAPVRTTTESTTVNGTNLALNIGQDTATLPCTNGGNIQAQIAAGCNPGWVFVGDDTTSGTGNATANATFPSNVVACTPNAGGTACAAGFTQTGHKAMAPGCGTGGTVYTNKFTLTDAAGTPYKFIANLYAVKRPASIYDDPRYTPDVPTIHFKAYAFDASTAVQPKPDPARPLTTVLSGQWFAIVGSIDMAGKLSRGQNTMGCSDGNADLTCAVNATALAGDYYYTEDLWNFNARPADWATNSASNTGWTYLASSQFWVLWDPAVIRTNDTTYAFGHDGTGASTKGNNFTTGGGTQLSTVGDYYPSDDFVIIASSASEFLNKAQLKVEMRYDYTMSNPPEFPDGLDGAEYGSNFQQGDVLAGWISVKAIGPSGSGATFDTTSSTNTNVTVGVGLGGATYTTDRDVMTNQKSANYPKWNYHVGPGEGVGTSAGSYNEQIAGVCIQ